MMDDNYLQSVTFPLSLIRSPVWLFDVDRERVIWANSAALVLWGSDDLSQLQQRDMSADMSRKVRERLGQYCADLAGTTNSMSEHWTFYPNGQPSTCECSISAIEPPDGGRWLMVNAIRQGNGSSSDTLYRSGALLHSSVCVSVYGTDGQLKYSNPAARSMLGADEMTLKARFFDEHDWNKVNASLVEGEEINIEARVRTATGLAWHNLNLEACPDPVLGKTSILVSETDVSARLHAQQRVNYLAYFDALTGLPNRTSWFSNLKTRLDTVNQSDQCLAVLFIDLDRFKVINDTLGHAVGDKVLVAVAERLGKCLGSNEYLARLGGDEFVMLLEDDSTGEISGGKASRIVEALALPMRIDSHELSITPSIGISKFPSHAVEHTQLMQQADLAMYAAKETGCGFLHFQRHMATQLKQRNTIERDLDHALDTSRLQVYYQPKLCAATGSILGAEALLRWNHPVLGWISPSDFIAVAEESGRIGDVTTYVLHEALRQQSHWSSQGHDIAVAVNVSPLEFRAGDLVSRVEKALAATENKAQNLELEITESMLMTDSELIQKTLGDLHQLGVKLSLDDFGSGYSNLGYLQKFPFDSIKIDRSFLCDGAISPVVDLIIGVGKKLSLQVIAEGVETARQRDFLVKHGCDQLQGFLFAKPLNVSMATRFLHSQKKDRDCWPMSSEVAA